MNLNTESGAANFRLPPRTRLVCRAMQVLSVLFAMGLFAAAFVAAPVKEITEGFWQALQPDVREAVHYSSAKKALVTAIAGLLYFNMLLVMLGAFRVFGAFATRPAFSPGPVKAVRFLGWMVMLSALISLAGPTMMIAAMTFDNPDGLRSVSLSISSLNIYLLLIGVVIMLTGQVLTEAARVAEENGQFI